MLLKEEEYYSYNYYYVIIYSCCVRLFELLGNLTSQIGQPLKYDFSDWPALLLKKMTSFKSVKKHQILKNNFFQPFTYVGSGI
jgi:hypothetical protein